jgi:hypothetical protein
MCYSFAMHLKPRFAAATLLVLAVAVQVCSAQASKPAASVPANKPAGSAPHAAGSASAPAPASTPSATPFAAPADTTTPPSGSSANPNCTNGPCDVTPAHITSVNAPPSAASPGPWSLPDRIKWIGVALLLLISYVGVFLAISLLRKIERQTHYAETTAQAAADAAKAALLFAESHARAERPWIVVAPSPTPGANNNFSIVATNRGRSPARIVTLAEGIAILKDEAQLPPDPAFKSDPRAPLTLTILLPGESANIKSFSRDEVQSVCASPEQVTRVEDWEEKIFLYGKVTYAELVEPGDKVHESNWCCWYVHGRQKSGMLTAGPAEYNRHT